MVEALADFLMKEESGSVRPGESAVDCAIRLIRTRRPKVRGKGRVRLFSFSRLLYAMERYEQWHGEDLALEVLADGSGRVMEWEGDRELFWFDTPEQLYRRLNLKRGDGGGD
jgi:hypothetical protein